MKDLLSIFLAADTKLVLPEFSGMKDMNVNINLPDVDKNRLLAHLDHSNPNSFEVEDLSRLIKQVFWEFDCI